MSNTIEITINGITELTAAIRDLVEVQKQIMTGYSTARQVVTTGVATVETPTAQPVKRTRKAAAPVETEAAPAPVEAPAPVAVAQPAAKPIAATKEIDYARELKPALIDFDGKFGIEALRNVLNKNGVDRATQLKPENYANVLADIAAYTAAHAAA